MALVNKSQGRAFPTKLELSVGETVKGYVQSFDESNQHPGSFYIIIVKENGERVTMSAKGNLRYRHKDGDIALGVYTEITRNADKASKKKKGTMVADFTLLQDADLTTPAGLGETSELDAVGITSDVAQLKPKSAVATRAAELAKQVNK